MLNLNAGTMHGTSIIPVPRLSPQNGREVGGNGKKEVQRIVYISKTGQMLFSFDFLRERQRMTNK